MPEVNIKEAIKRLDEEKKSESTKRIWRTVLKNFKNGYRLDDEGILQWIRDLRAEGIKESTIRTYVKSLKRYCRIYDININWDYAFPPQPVKEFDPGILSREEVMDIINTADWNKGVMFRTAYECVTRPQELCNIMRDDVDLSNNLVTIYGLKGSATFDNPVTNELKELLSSYIQKHNTQRGEFLFETSHHKKWDSNYLSSIVFKKVCKEAIGRDVRMIDFSRHTRVTHLLQDGHISPHPVKPGEEKDMNFYYVVRLVRHKNLNQTLRYAHVAGADVYDKLEKFM